MSILTKEEILKTVDSYEKLDFKDLKISYLILKPNGSRHYKATIKEIIRQQYTIIGQFAIKDYETLNMALHISQPESMRYILPISQMYKDLYGNYGVLLIIGKKNITYPNFALQVVSLKRYLRARFSLEYVAYAFDTSKLGSKNEQQRLTIVDKEGKSTGNEYFKEEGTFMVIAVNEVHSPDEDINSLVKEIRLLSDMGLLDQANELPEETINNMMRYKTFEYVKDMK